MLDEQVDLVAGDFNGAAWRRTTNANNISIIEEALGSRGGAEYVVGPVWVSQNSRL